MSLDRYEADAAELTERVAVDLAVENALPRIYRAEDLIDVWGRDLDRVTRADIEAAEIRAGWDPTP